MINYIFGDDHPALRLIGPLPCKLLIGHADHIVVFADILGNWMPRCGRTGEKIR